MNKYYNISGTYTKKFVGFIPLPYFNVIEKVSFNELQSKGPKLKFKEKTGYYALEGSLLVTEYAGLPTAQDPKPGEPKKEIVNNLNINIMNENLGYDELVDTLADAVGVAVKIGEALADGVQLQDAFVLLGEAKTIEEIYNDAPTAWAEFKDLTPDESILAETALAIRLNADPGSVVDIIRQAISLVTRGYVYTTDLVHFVKQFKKEA